MTSGVPPLIKSIGWTGGIIESRAQMLDLQRQLGTGRVAETYSDAVRIVQSPCPAPFEVYLVWTTRTHKSAMHDWLRKLILECVASSPPAASSPLTPDE